MHVHVICLSVYLIEFISAKPGCRTDWLTDRYTDHKVFLWQCIPHYKHKHYACTCNPTSTCISHRVYFSQAWLPDWLTDWRIYWLRYQCKLNACNTSLVGFEITITNNKRWCCVMSLPYVCILLVQLKGYWGGFCCYLKPCAGSTPRDGFFIAAHVSLVSYNLHSYEMFLIWSNWT